MSTGDDLNLSLDRFLRAQDPVYDAVVAELQAGRKRTHWMWFVFPQLRGLGQSPTAIHYGIKGIEEARAYHAHPVLGARLEFCTNTVLTHPKKSAHDIFGHPDDLKLRSSMTLFDVVDGRPGNVFRTALDVFYSGRPDDRTLALLRSE